MIIFIILLFFILFTALIFPLHFSFSLSNGKFDAELRFLIFGFSLNNLNKKKNKRKNVKNKKSKAKKNESSFLGSSVKKIKDYSQVILILVLGIKKAFASMNKLEINITVAGEDSAKVGIMYGQICSIIALLARFVFENNTKNKIIKVEPDFSCKDTTGTILNCKFSITLLNIVKCLVFSIKEVLRRGVLRNG